MIPDTRKFKTKTQQIRTQARQAPQPTPIDPDTLIHIVRASVVLISLLSSHMAV